MLDPRMLQALQNYLGTALSGLLTPEQLATVNTLVQNAPQDPAIQATTVGMVNPGTSAGPLPGTAGANPDPGVNMNPDPTIMPAPGDAPGTIRPLPNASPQTGSNLAGDPMNPIMMPLPGEAPGSARPIPDAPMQGATPASGGGGSGGGGVGSTIGFNGQGLITTTKSSAPAAAGGVPTDSSGHVTGSGPGYAGAGVGNNRFLPNGQIQLAWDDPDADKLVAKNPGLYVKQAPPPGTPSPNASAGQTVGTVSQSQTDYMNQQIAATAAANKAAKPAAPVTSAPAPTAGAPNTGQASAGQQVGTVSQSQQDYIKQQIAATAAANAKAGGGSTGMARGGVIREPIEGMGMQTGKTYEFGERGPETVTPGAPRGASPAPGQMPGAAPMIPTAETMAPQPQMQPQAPRPVGPPVGMAQASWAKTKPGVLNFIKNQPLPSTAGKPPPKGDPNRREVPI